MKLRIPLTVCFLLVFAGSLFAQSADPVTGTWQGYMGPGTNPQYAITMSLKLDKAAVTGTLVGLPEPGDVKNGTFDPKTGAVALQLGVTGQPATRLTFEGTLVKGLATGRVRGDNQTGTFTIAKFAGDSPATQQPANANVAEDLRKGFEEVSDWVTKAADMVPADKYNYRPTDSVRTFGQLVGHIADSYNFYCSRGAGQKVEWSDAIEKGNTDKATVVPKLKLALDKCNSAYAGANGQFGPLFGNVGHTSLHYGNMITYIRMLGMKPPSS